MLSLMASTSPTGDYALTKKNYRNYSLKILYYRTLIYYGKTMVLWKNYGTMEKNYGTMEKTMVLFRKVRNFDL